MVSFSSHMEVDVLIVLNISRRLMQPRALILPFDSFPHERHVYFYYMVMMIGVMPHVNAAEGQVYRKPFLPKAMPI